MDGCQTLYRVLTLLLGVASLSVVIFTCYDFGANFMICRLPFVIFGRLGIACSTLFISSCCGLLPMPKIPLCRNLPTPWQLWKCRCCQSRPPSDSPQPQTSGEVKDVITSLPLKHKDGETPGKTYGTFPQSRKNQFDADNSYQPQPSTSKAHNVSTASPVQRERGESPGETYGKKKERKKVRFSLPEGDKDRTSREEIKPRARRKYVPHYRHADPNKFLEKVHLRHPNDQSRMDRSRSRLVELGVKIAPPSARQQRDQDPFSRVLVRQNWERYEGSPNAVSLPIPIPKRERPVYDARPGTPDYVRREIKEFHARVYGMPLEPPGDKTPGTEPSSRSSGKSSSSETDTKEDCFDSNVGDKTSL